MKDIAFHLLVMILGTSQNSTSDQPILPGWWMPKGATLELITLLHIVRNYHFPIRHATHHCLYFPENFLELISGWLHLRVQVN